MINLLLRTAVLTITLYSTAFSQTRTVNVGDAMINYEITGAGKTVVFIHGWAQSLRTWDELVPVFNKHYRVLRFDRRGFGKSTGFADPSADPDDLRILLDSLGIQSAYIVGLSAGANAAIRFAAAFPNRTGALVFYGGGRPQGFPIAPDQPPQASWAQIARDYGMDSLGKFIYASPLAWHSPATPEQERSNQQRFNARWAEYSGRDLLDPHPQSGRVPPARWDRIETLTMPTLIVNGDHDLPLQLVVADSLARRLPNARKVLIVNGGHGAHIMQPEQFNRALLDFFASLPKS